MATTVRRLTLGVIPPRLLLLLPPSEGKRAGGDARRWAPGGGTFGRRLAGPRREVAGALAAIDGGDARLLGVGGAWLDRAQAANRRVLRSPTMAAHRRYSGVVWEHLDPATVPDRSPIVVVSALAGLLGADDAVPDHKLKMSASLPGIGKLSTWWRPAVTAAIAPRARGAFVVDLLSLEHRTAWDAAATRRLDGVTVSFVARGGRGRAVGHGAKAAKGLLARHLLLAHAAGGAAQDALAAWAHDDYELVVTPLTPG